MQISIIIPVYQAEGIIPELLKRLQTTLLPVTNDYEIILIDDGSIDKSWMTLQSRCKDDKRIKALKLSRNFGQHSAITTGIDYCSGDQVIVMDCDLQDRPEEIPKLLDKAKEGFDIVYARRVNRIDSFWKKFYAALFYKMYSWLTGIKHDGSIANFGVYSCKVTDVLKKMKEPMRAFSPMVRWVGFNKAFINVEHGKRHSGRSTYNFSKVFNLGADIILSYSNKPLKLIIRLGFVISIMSFLIAVYYLTMYFMGKIEVSGYTSIILSIWFLGGLIILNLGIIGLYISKIFAGIKNRPLYIVDESINL